MDRDPRRNSALLKLDLYCKGLRFDEDALGSSDDGREILRTRAGLGSGLEAILPGNLWTNIPVTEPFAADSPYFLAHRNGRLWIDHDVWGQVAPIELSPRPAWYSGKTSTNRSMTRIGSLQGTYLGIYPTKVCEYWIENPQMQCRFCSVGFNLGADDADVKSVDEVVEVVRAARRESGITYVDFNTGHYSGDTYLDALEPYIVRVKEETNVLIGVQTPPHHDLKRYRDLRRMGVNRVSFCFELYNRERFAEVCPGKHREYGLDRYLEAVEFCANEVGPTGRGFEPWVTNGEIIAGLEDPADSIAAIDWITGVGAIPTVCVFRPLDKTAYEHLPPPTTEAMIPIFQRLYEACMERGLPIGVAPNIHVSLVMLPNECRGLLDDPNRFRLGELKLAAKRKFFAMRFKRELRAAEAQRIDHRVA